MGTSLFATVSVKVVGSRKVHALAWSQDGLHSAGPLLAVALEGSEILILKEDGEPLEKVQISRRGRGCECLHLAWSPSASQGELLALGWGDGSVQVWSLRDRQAREEASEGAEAHAGESITVLKWSPEGEKLISADARPSGSREKDVSMLAVWTVVRSRPSVVCTYRNPAVGGYTHAVFRTAGRATKPTTATSAFAAAECAPFYCGGERGTICYGNDKGSCVDAICGLDAAIAAMLYDEGSDTLLVITRLHALAHYRLTDPHAPQPIRKVMLSMGREGLHGALWAGAGHLAIVSADQLVRVHVAGADAHYMLRPPIDPPELSHHGQHHLLALAHESCRGTLVAGTREGFAFMWRASPTLAPEGAETSEGSWEALPPVKLPSPPLGFAWDPTGRCLATRGARGLWLLPETVLHRQMCGEWALVQLSAQALQLEHIDGTLVPIEAEMRVCGTALQEGTLALWSDSLVKVYRFESQSEYDPNPETDRHPTRDRASDGRPTNMWRCRPPSLLAAFECRVRAATAWGEALYLCVGNKVQVTNLYGKTTQTLTLSEAEGAPIAVHATGDANGRYLAVGTDRGHIKAWDLSRRDPRQHTPGRRLLGGEASPREASARDTSRARTTSVRITNDGRRISATMDVRCDGADCRQSNASPASGASIRRSAASATPAWSPSTKLWVYLVELDAVEHFDFGARVPTAHFWDAVETRLVAVETHPAPGVPSPREGGGAREVVTLFSTPEHGLKMQHEFHPDHELEALISIQVPHFYFATTPQCNEDARAGKHQQRLCGHVMRDFVGMEGVDEDTRHALVELSYQLTVGNVDEAYRAVAHIDSSCVWESMARMCIKTRRLDVAQVCLGKLGHAAGARAVRELARKHTDAQGCLREPEFCAAMVALQLGLVEEAQAFYAACGRDDLRNQLLQATGDWEGALEVARTSDRIHLKTTHYAYARQLQVGGQAEHAIKQFEHSARHRAEVPRMLLDASQMGRLQAYIDKGSDGELLTWWAQLAESNDQLDTALQYYARAEDHLAQVRVLSFRNELKGAAQVAEASENTSAAYHLARQLEARGETEEAIKFYKRAGRFNHVVRVAKEHGIPFELSALALQQMPPRVMIEAAQFFESRGMLEKAVVLYHKGGDTSKAVEACFRGGLLDALRDIANVLSTDRSNADHKLLCRCADFFLEHGWYEQSVHLFIATGEVTRALELCVHHNVTISEEMAEDMGPKPGVGVGISLGASTANAEGESARCALLSKVAKCCKRQGSYQLACKKYTQAGNRVKAMKCLLKSGDAEKIVYFASVSRVREVYILAANYLQTIDRHSDPKVMRDIVDFYTKAEAFEHLSAFHDACAQVEINEYRDYEKAAAALHAALAVQSQVRAQGNEHAVAQLQQKISHVEQLVTAHKMVTSNPQRMIELCKQLLEQHHIENALRVGDVYALMVEWYHSQGQMQEAYALVESMRARGIIVSPYLDHEMIQDIHDAVGMPLVVDEPTPPPQSDSEQIAELIEVDDLAECEDDYR